MLCLCFPEAATYRRMSLISLGNKETFWGHITWGLELGTQDTAPSALYYSGSFPALPPPRPSLLLSPCQPHPPKLTYSLKIDLCSPKLWAPIFPALPSVKNYSYLQFKKSQGTILIDLVWVMCPFLDNFYGQGGDQSPLKPCWSEGIKVLQMKKVYFWKKRSIAGWTD